MLGSQIIKLLIFLYVGAVPPSPAPAASPPLAPVLITQVDVPSEDKGKQAAEEEKAEEAVRPSDSEETQSDEVTC